MTYKVLLATKTIQSIVYRHSLDSISIVVIVPCRMCSKIKKMHYGEGIHCLPQSKFLIFFRSHKGGLLRKENQIMLISACKLFIVPFLEIFLEHSVRRIYLLYIEGSLFCSQSIATYNTEVIR